MSSSRSVYASKSFDDETIALNHTRPAERQALRLQRDSTPRPTSPSARSLQCFSGEDPHRGRAWAGADDARDWLCPVSREPLDLNVCTAGVGRGGTLRFAADEMSSSRLAAPHGVLCSRSRI